MDYQKIGDLISKLRKEKGLTQKELADKLFITDRAVSKWERGLGCPDVSLLDDLSKILDISIIEILKGRRLDKDELIENSTIIESMNYSKENFKHKFRKYFNNICVFIIIFILALLFFNNIKSLYYLNKTYYNYYPDSSLNKTVWDVNNKIEIIRKNKGKYSEEEYQRILLFINTLGKDLDKEGNFYYINHDYYSYGDLVYFLDSHQNYLYYDKDSNAKEIYEIIYKYDKDIIDNVISYYNKTYYLTSMSISLRRDLENPYINNKSIQKNIVENINSFIEERASRDNNILDSIMKAGDINE